MQSTVQFSTNLKTELDQTWERRYPQKKLASTKPTVSGVHWNSGMWESSILTVATPTLHLMPAEMKNPSAANRACVYLLLQ